MNRPRPQQDRSRATVDKILAAADGLIAERGSSAVTTTQIATAAGVSVGALYRFFPDKEAVVAAIADRYLVDAAERFVPLLAGIAHRGDVADALRGVILVAAELALAHPGYYRLTREIAPGDDGSAGAAVRLAIIDEFDSLMVRLGGAPGDADRRRTIVMLIETVRHTLANAPSTEPERSRVVAELTDMVVGHARNRLQG